jgi:hypothetical protein
VFFAVRGAREVRSHARLALVAPAIALALVHAVFLGGDRYHEPLVPLFAALASPALERLAQRAISLAGRHVSPPLTPPAAREGDRSVS